MRLYNTQSHLIFLCTNANLLILSGENMPRSTNKSKYAVLGMLSLGLKTGYEIKKFMQNCTSYFWAESDGQLYPILSSLREEGLAECNEIAGEPGKRAKKEYQLSDKGRDVLSDWLCDLDNKLTVRDELMLKCVFAAEADPEAMIEQLEQYRSQQRQLLDINRKAKVDVEEADTLNDKQKTALMIIVNRGNIVTKAKLQWVEETIENLKGM